MSRRELEPAYRSGLSKQQRRALAEAADLVLDWAREVAGDRDDMAIDPEGFLASMLPRRYLPRYTPEFAAQFAGAVREAAAAIASAEHTPLLACTAQELAAHLIAVEAEAILEAEGHPKEAASVRDEVYDRVIGDSDILFLYDDAYDGIDEANPDLGALNLSFADWFTPFDQQREEE